MIIFVKNVIIHLNNQLYIIVIKINNVLMGNVCHNKNHNVMIVIAKIHNVLYNIQIRIIIIVHHVIKNLF